MEYPRLIAGGTSGFAPKDDFKLFGPEEVIVHEFGHQYWQTLVASNEFEEAWLDEGFTTYSTGLIMDLAYGPSRLYLPIAPIPVPLDHWLSIDKLSERQLMRLGPIVDRGRDQIVREAWKYYDFISYGVNSYPKAAAVLYQLQNEIGDDVMARVMRTYFQRWHFNHPGTQDFITIAEEISGRDLDRFFDQLVFGTGYLDYDVTEARSVRIEATGVFDTPEGRVTHTSRELKQKRKKDKENEEKQALYRSTVTITNHGIIQYPVEILVQFKDGEEVREHWDSSYRWVRYEYERKSELDRVIIDPDERILIDLNQTNNSWIKDPELRADLRWILQCIFWIQNLFYGL